MRVNSAILVFYITLVNVPSAILQENGAEKTGITVVQERKEEVGLASFVCSALHSRACAAVF